MTHIMAAKLLFIDNYTTEYYFKVDWAVSSITRPKLDSSSGQMFHSPDVFVNVLVGLPESEQQHR